MAASSRSDVANLAATMTVMQQCIACGDIFTDITSLGRNECRRHAGVMQCGYSMPSNNAVDTYSCCFVSPRHGHPRYAGPVAARGCIRCDHTSEMGLPEDIVLPYARARILFGHDVESRNTERRDDMLVIHRTASGQ